MDKAILEKDLTQIKAEKEQTIGQLNRLVGIEAYINAKLAEIEKVATETAKAAEEAGA